MIEDYELGVRYYNLNNRSTWTPRGGYRFRAPRKRQGNHYVQLLVPSAEKKLLFEMYDRIRVAQKNWQHYKERTEFASELRLMPCQSPMASIVLEPDLEFGSLSSA